jgi:hypothetical protein
MGSHGIITSISRTNQAEGKVFRLSFQYAHIAIVLEGQNTSMAAAMLIGAKSTKQGAPHYIGRSRGHKDPATGCLVFKDNRLLITCNEPETVRKCHDKQHKQCQPF